MPTATGKRLTVEQRLERYKLEAVENRLELAKLKRKCKALTKMIRGLDKKIRYSQARLLPRNQDE